MLSRLALIVFLAIRHGEISTECDERGYDWVDPDEVRTLAPPAPSG